SSHALIGGYAGAAVAKAGLAAILTSGWIKTLVFIVVAPLMGLVLALTLTVALSWALRRSLPRKVDRTFRVLQLGSAALYSLGRDLRRGRGAPPLRRPLGGGGADRLGVDPHDPRGCGDRWAVLRTAARRAAVRGAGEGAQPSAELRSRLTAYG